MEAGADVSFWFHTAARGDVNWIRIGDRTNVQDGTVLHVTHERHPLRLGAGVVIGHAAVLHGCTVEDGALIGIGARVLDGAVVETGAQVGAGAVVAPGDAYPGAPACPRRAGAGGAAALRPRSARRIPEIVERYVRAQGELPAGACRRGWRGRRSSGGSAPPRG